MMTKIRGGCAVGVVALLSFAFCTRLGAQESAQESYVESVAISAEDIARMGVVFAPALAVDTTAGVRYPATVINSPESSDSVTAAWGGTIIAWKYIAGAAVTAGSVLATLRSQDVLPLQEAWMEAVTALQSANFALGKDERLFEQGVIARQRLNQARLAQQQAAFTERSARALLAQGGFDAAMLQALREQGRGLGEYYLIAGADGILSQRLYSVGAYVQAGDVLATLNSGARLWARAQVSARAAAALQIGQRLSVAGSAEPLTLRQRNYVIDSSNQTIELLAEFDDQVSFTPGQILSLILPPAAPGVLIPARAVVHSGSSTTVYVRSEGGVEARTLPLQSIGADYLATTGIAVGEEIAVQGTAVLKGIQLGLGGGE